MAIIIIILLLLLLFSLGIILSHLYLMTLYSIYLE